jgi:hypothetical protein
LEVNIRRLICFVAIADCWTAVWLHDIVSYLIFYRMDQFYSSVESTDVQNEKQPYPDTAEYDEDYCFQVVFGSFPCDFVEDIYL